MAKFHLTKLDAEQRDLLYVDFIYETNGKKDFLFKLLTTLGTRNMWLQY